jgi:hypothetical protein
LPSIITPISNKSFLGKLLFGDVLTIAFAYIILCITALFAFGDATLKTCSPTPGPACKIQQLYTLNFESFGNPIFILNLY